MFCILIYQYLSFDKQVERLQIVAFQNWFDLPQSYSFSYSKKLAINDAQNFR